MEPIAIAIICVAVFGVVAGVTAFIRQLLLSRDKKLNDLSQQRALVLEARELEKLRDQMSSNQRFDSHYHVLGNNKQAIWYLDQKIEDIFTKKSALIDRYAQVMMQESSAIIGGEKLPERKIMCDRLKEEMDKELIGYDKELELLQSRRAVIWDSHIEFQDCLLEQEKKRNTHLDNVYQRHTSLLEKIYFRHNENSEVITKELINAGNMTYKSVLMAPIELLMSYFKLSSNLSSTNFQQEILSRQAVEAIEQKLISKSDINGAKDVESVQEPYSSEPSLLAI